MTMRLLREPIDDALTAPYWDGFQEGELRLPACSSCGEFHWYPQHRCPHCQSASIEWTPISGEGTVFTWVQINYHFRLPFLEDKTPLYTGLVIPRVTENIRLPSLLEMPDDESPEMGMEVAVRFVEQADGDLVFPVFTPP